MNNDNFYSIERLVEFGMGMSVAKQMVSSMNQALQNVYIPGPHNMLAAGALHYFLVLDGRQAGPFSETEVSRLINEGTVTKNSLAWRPGLSGWQLVESLPDVLKLVALAPPPLPGKGA